MKLIVGLGNPGLRYKGTRHNIGFLIVREISKNFAIPLKKNKYSSIFGDGSIYTARAGLCLPETYMNLSGQAVSEAVRYQKTALEDLLIICDDINLKLGSLRLRKRGSAGGHNGMASIIDQLGTEEFPRLRVGVGSDRKISNMAEFVLRPFAVREKSLIKGIVKQAAECAATWVKDGPDKAMSLFNRIQSA